MANPKAIQSIFTTVSKGAASISAIFDTTTRSIGMIDAIVSKASDEQKLRYRKERRTFVHNLVREASSEQAEADIIVLEFCAQSVQHDELYTASHKEFSDLFADELLAASPSIPKRTTK